MSLSTTPDAPPRRAALLLNRRAGTLLAHPELHDRIGEALREAGFEILPIEEEAAPDLQGRLALAMESDAPLVIIGGGDGSIRSAAAALAGSGKVLGIIPLGTLNLLARDLGLPLDPVEAARLLGEAQPKAIDAGYVNDEIFLCQSVIGLLNTVGRHREKLRGSGPLAGLRWLRVLVRTVWRHRPIRLALRLPGRPGVKRIWARTISVVNGPYADEPGRMFHRPRLDTGELVLYSPKRFGIAWMLRMLIAMALGRWQAQREVDVMRLRDFSLLMRRSHITVMNDGETLLLPLPLHYRIAPRMLTVMAPVPSEAQAGAEAGLEAGA
ncbi:diacylglycerol kinase [Acetobacteraceae bacterium H6797]|nr:diacylglycerol kinase [Acetobacteraceae bacterium H6797]